MYCTGTAQKLHRDCTKLHKNCTESAIWLCRLRDIFIDERMGADRVEGPENHQAAMLMGNTVRTWLKHYDKNYLAREAQAGVDAMGTWRQGMLNKTSQPPSSQPVVDDGTDSEGIDVCLTDDTETETEND